MPSLPRWSSSASESRQPGPKSPCSSGARVVHAAEHQRPVGAGNEIAAQKGEVAGADVDEASLQAVEQCLRVGGRARLPAAAGRTPRRAARSSRARGPLAPCPCSRPGHRCCQGARAPARPWWPVAGVSCCLQATLDGHTLRLLPVRLLTHFAAKLATLVRNSYRKRGHARAIAFGRFGAAVQRRCGKAARWRPIGRRERALPAPPGPPLRCGRWP